MSSDRDAAPAFRIELVLDVEVCDAVALRQQALDALVGTSYTAEDHATPEELAERDRADVRTDLAYALGVVLNPHSLADDLDGVEAHGSHYSVTTTDNDTESDLAKDREARPPFDVLFAACTCNRDDCELCGGFQLTPRTAAGLWFALQHFADQGYRDVEEHGDEPVEESGIWVLFADYPRITFSQDAVWRRQAARSFDDLAADLAAGAWPTPRSPGEEMALHLAIGLATDLGADGALDDWIAAYPAHPDDFDKEACVEELFEDTDILGLFNASRDGMEDPDDPENQRLGIGDYRPVAWFRPFRSEKARDGRRPFRR
ncbi:hypothetical protein [Pseudofrankia sp. DC12]|uniref:hypothetical protein n=1 Tax=Pseudofrankia sp. DC12 TaxID=683315 RepID=UPI000695F0C2|nr:hypothetical protein [Pseudofrankia sp. DC12]